MMHNKGEHPQFEHARSLFNAERYSDSIRILAHLLQEDKYRLRSLNNISSCLIRLNNLHAALRYANRALFESSEYLPALQNKTEILLAKGQVDEAIACLRLAVTVDPTQESSWLRLNELFCSRGQTQEALENAEAWSAACPLSSKAKTNIGTLHLFCSRPKEAVHAFREAINLDSNNSQAFHYLYISLQQLSHFDEALLCIKKAAELNPTSFEIATQMGIAHWDLAQTKEAKLEFHKALALNPRSAAAFMNLYLLIPPIPHSREEVCSHHNDFLKGLKRIKKTSFLTLDLYHESYSHTFHLAYHNHDVREQMEGYIDCIRKLARPILDAIALNNYLSDESTSKRNDQKIRIGFISKNLSYHSNAFAFDGLIKHLSRDLFHVSLIHTFGSIKTSHRDQLDGLCDQTLYLSKELGEINRRLRSLNLDILYFTDLGMTPYECMIPFLQTTPIQITGWGVPHTSGIKEIDHYISSTNLQPAQAEHQYTERLVRLPGGLPCCFQAETIVIHKLPREYFMLPPEDFLIGCLQSIHKLHPDFDFVLEEIALQNPESVFVFAEDRIPSRTLQFIQRLERNAPNVSSRCIFLALMRRDEFQSLCHCMDIMLDPIYYGSGITFFDASFSGTPIVTIEGKELRSRIVSCGYREMGLDDPPIAHSVIEYIELATALAKDTNRREKMRASILKHNHRIYNRVDYVRNFEDFCVTITRKNGLL